MAGEARPVRTELKWSWVASTDLCMRAVASETKSSIVLTASLLRGCRDQRAHALPGNHPADVARGELEHVDREIVVHAERECGGVHHLEAALDRLQMGDLG